MALIRDPKIHENVLMRADECSTKSSSYALAMSL